MLILAGKGLDTVIKPICVRACVLHVSNILAIGIVYFRQYLILAKKLENNPNSQLGISNNQLLRI